MLEGETPGLPSPLGQMEPGLLHFQETLQSSLDLPGLGDEGGLAKGAHRVYRGRGGIYSS